MSQKPWYNRNMTSIPDITVRFDNEFVDALNSITDKLNDVDKSLKENVVLLTQLMESAPQFSKAILSGDETGVVDDAADSA